LALCLITTSFRKEAAVWIGNHEVSVGVVVKRKMSASFGYMIPVVKPLATHFTSFAKNRELVLFLKFYCHRLKLISLCFILNILIMSSIIKFAF
jgi:hypothetical protein